MLEVILLCIVGVLGILGYCLAVIWHYDKCIENHTNEADPKLHWAFKVLCLIFPVFIVVYFTYRYQQWKIGKPSESYIDF